MNARPDRLRRFGIASTGRFAVLLLATTTGCATESHRAVTPQAVPTHATT
jgi:hypothetical protein